MVRPMAGRIYFELVLDDQYTCSIDIYYAKLFLKKTTKLVLFERRCRAFILKMMSETSFFIISCSTDISLFSEEKE